MQVSEGGPGRVGVSPAQGSRVWARGKALGLPSACKDPEARYLGSAIEVPGVKGHLPRLAAPETGV